jgi:hypothetical protein
MLRNGSLHGRFERGRRGSIQKRRGRDCLTLSPPARRWLCFAVLLRAYEPRATAGTLLQHVVRTHLERFLAETAAATDGAGVPRFIEREFREFLGCGSLSRGFARVRCGDCAFERLVPFSCKGRGFCPSCGGRRMAEQAAHLVDGVLPSVPVRQWVLTVPHRLRYRLAFDHGLCRAVLGVFVRAVLGWYRRRGRRAGAVDGRSGTITVVQRFGSGLELNVHFHTLAFDGVFAPGTDGTLRFHRLLPPSDADVTRLVATIARRVARLLVRRGVGAGLDAHDPLAAESLALAGLASAAVQGRLALGPCAGARVERIANDPDTPPADRRRLLQARCEGFDLHAGGRSGRRRSPATRTGVPVSPAATHRAGTARSPAGRDDPRRSQGTVA